MRNLITLGRSRISLDVDSQILTAANITAIAPVASSENEFYVTKGPSNKVSEIEVLHCQVHSQNAFIPYRE